MELLIIIILLILLAYDKTGKHKTYKSKSKKQNDKKAGNSEVNALPDEQQKREDITDIDFKKAYQSKYLLTKNEWHEFKTLQKVAEVKGYMICPKVRLLDIIEPIKGHVKYMTLFYKVQAKHVDFVICDKDVRIKAIIELDDASHNREDRKERDQFVDEILKSVGYKVIHTKAVTTEILDLI